MFKRRKKSKRNTMEENPGPSIKSLHRSLVIVDEALFGQRLLEQLSQVENFSDENILRSVARTCEGDIPNVIEALSLEVGPYSSDLNETSNVTWRRSFCVTDLTKACLEDSRDGVDIVEDVLDEVITCAVNKSVESNAVTTYTHFYHPLAGKEDVEKMTNCLDSTLTGLYDQRRKLEESYRVILVQAAKQIVVSYRRILLEQVARLRTGEEDAEMVAKETEDALLDVTMRVAELTVDFLKAATRSVVDSSMAEVKFILGRMSEDREIEFVSEL